VLNVSGMTSTTTVPSSTTICVFGNTVASTRKITNNYRVYLNTISVIYYYVNKANGVWGETPDTGEGIALEYSINGVSGWTALDTIDSGDVAGNTWTLRTVILSDATAQSYAGVYLRFRQLDTDFTSGDNWAVTTVIIKTDSGGISGGGSSSMSVMDFSSNTSFLNEGTLFTTPGSISGMTTSGFIPTNTPICLFDESTSERNIRTLSKVYLTSFDEVKFYVNKADGTWGEQPDSGEDLYLQYSHDLSSWSTLDYMVTTQIRGNTWSLRQVTIPNDAKSYDGVYLRFSQPTLDFPTGDNWAVTSVVPANFQRERSTSFAVIDLNSQTGLSLDDYSYRQTSFLTTPFAMTGMTSSSSTVPSSTPICVFGPVSSLSVSSISSPRYLRTTYKVYLTNIERLSYYVNRANGVWGESPDSGEELILQYSVDNSTWYDIETIPVSISGNIWTLRDVSVPSDAKNLNGVYLRFAQPTLDFPTGDNWAITSLIANTEAVSLASDSTNTTRYIGFVENTTGSISSIFTSSSDLRFNPGIGSFSTRFVSAAATVYDAAGDVRKIVNLAKAGPYTLQSSDIGKLVNITTGGVTVPSLTFGPGDAITIYNNSSGNQTITQGSSVTMYLAGSSTSGNRTLSQRGVCTVLCVALNEFVITGAGLL
jgi:hypothetical protein